MFTLIDWFSASWSLLLLALTEVILLMYIYGHRNVFENISEMDIKLPVFSKIYWKVNWMGVTPVILAFITVATWYFFTPCSYGGYIFPSWVQLMGWLMAATPLVIVILMGGYEYHRRNNVLGKPTSAKAMFKPVDKWGPAEKAALAPLPSYNGITDLQKAVYDNQAYQ